MDITFTSSLYRTEKHIRHWAKRLIRFSKDAERLGLTFQIHAIANDPTAKELETLDRLKQFPWFNLVIVPRETIYGSWNRGTIMATSLACSPWNVDDNRYADAALDGVRIIRENIAQGKDKTVVYFPFTFKRYVRIFGFPILAKVRHMALPPFDRKEFTRSMNSGPFFMFSKKTFDEIGPFDSTFKVAGDFEWCARAAAQGAEFVLSKLNGGVFTSDGTTLSGKITPNIMRENMRVFEKYGALDKLAAERQKLERAERR